jgi:hypothetical protein
LPSKSIFRKSSCPFIALSFFAADGSTSAAGLVLVFGVGAIRFTIFFLPAARGGRGLNICDCEVVGGAVEVSVISISGVEAASTGADATTGEAFVEAAALGADVAFDAAAGTEAFAATTRRVLPP